MRNIYKNIITCFSLAAILASCETELDLSNPNALSLEELLQTNNGFELLANGVLDSYQKVPANEFLLTELRTDNSRANSANGNLPNINAYIIDANNGDVATYYSNNMHTIYRANTIIDNRFLAPESQQYAVGEAYFMRALSHFNLVRAYENVPYIDKVLDISADEARDYPQLPPSEVYEKIIADFRTSIAYLSGQDLNRYRPSAGAAICLAAKAYLSQPEPNYAEAELLLSSVIENSSSYGFGLLFTERSNADQQVFNADLADPSIDVLTDAEYNYTLMQNYANVFGNEFSGSFSESDAAPDGDFSNNSGFEINDEVIFSIAYDLESSDNYVTSDSGLDDQIETDSESFSFAMTLQGGSNGVNLATTDLLKILTPELEPVRFYPNIIKNSYNPADPLTDTFTSKYPTTGEIGDNDWIVLRYADVLLLYVEAIMADENSTTDVRAIDAFNQVRTRAGFAEVVSVSKQELLYERRVEFVFENQRLYDLIRFGEVDNVLQAFSDANSLTYNPNKKYLPFPQREIDNVPNFYNQNKGY